MNMIITRMLGSREHLKYCYSFMQLEAFGAMHLSQAIENLEEGVIVEQDVSLLPLSTPFKIIKLTGRGRKVSRNCLKLWNDIYLPAFKEGEFKRVDEYASSKVGENIFAINFERFQKEREAGRVNQMISKCPPMSEYM